MCTAKNEKQSIPVVERKETSNLEAIVAALHGTNKELLREINPVFLFL
jgi:hypothetical protein